MTPTLAKIPYISEPNLTPEQIKQSLNRLHVLLIELAKGKYLTLEGMPYPIAMGENGEVGFLYAGTRIPATFTLAELLKLAYHMPPIIYRENGLAGMKYKHR